MFQRNVLSPSLGSLIFRRKLFYFPLTYSPLTENTFCFMIEQRLFQQLYNSVIQMYHHIASPYMLRPFLAIIREVFNKRKVKHSDD